MVMVVVVVDARSREKQFGPLPGLPGEVRRGKYFRLLAPSLLNSEATGQNYYGDT